MAHLKKKRVILPEREYLANLGVSWIPEGYLKSAELMGIQEEDTVIHEPFSQYGHVCDHLFNYMGLLCNYFHPNIRNSITSLSS